MYNIDFEKIKQVILPYFIKVYGEEYRDLIISRMEKIKPIFYTNIIEQEKVMRSMKRTKKIELTMKFLEENGIFIPDDIKIKVIKCNATYELDAIPEVKNILMGCFGESSYQESFRELRQFVCGPTNNKYDIRKNIETLSYFGKSINEEDYNDWCVTEDAKKVFEKLEMYKKQIKNLDNEYNDFKQQFNQLNESIQKCNAIETKIFDEYNLEFLKSIKEYMDDNDKKLLDEYMMSDRKKWFIYKNQFSILSLIGDSINSKNTLIDAFTDEAEEKLNDNNTSSFSKNCILDNRRKYYKQIGLSHEEITDDLLINGMNDKTPSKNFVRDVIEKRNTYLSKAELELLKTTSSFYDNLQQIASFNLDIKQDWEENLINIIQNNYQCIIPSVYNNEAVSILFFFPESCLPEYIDTMFIHEINHSIELCLTNYNNGKPILKTGYQIVDEKEDQTYVQNSENINQRIAMEITELMHNDNVYLFDNPNTSKVKGGTSYEDLDFITEKFWYKFKHDIMHARISQDLNSLYEVVGRDNFEKLNQLVNDYAALPRLQLVKDLISKKETDLTRKRDMIFLSANAIVDDMLNFQNNKQNEQAKTI